MDANSEAMRGADPRTCRRVREQLCEPAVPAILAVPAVPAAVATHLAACPECAAFARRLQLVRQELARPLAAAPGELAQDIEPDAGFAARVLARAARPAELMGWAAFRALPAALGLALALAGLGWLGLPQTAAAPQSPLLDEPPSSDQLLTWSSLSPEVWP